MTNTACSLPERTYVPLNLQDNVLDPAVVNLSMYVHIYKSIYGLQGLNLLKKSEGTPLQLIRKQAAQVTTIQYTIEQFLIRVS